MQQGQLGHVKKRRAIPAACVVAFFGMTAISCASGSSIKTSGNSAAPGGEKVVQADTDYEEQFDQILSLAEIIDPPTGDYRDTKFELEDIFWAAAVESDDIYLTVVALGDTWLATLGLATSNLEQFVNDKRNELRSLSLDGSRKQELETLRTVALSHYYAWQDYSREYLAQISRWLTSWSTGTGYAFTDVEASMEGYKTDINRTFREFCGALGSSQPSNSGAAEYAERIAALCAD